MKNKIHKLKLDSRYYEDSASGLKTFEIRENDRNYHEGDILELRELVWSPKDKDGMYTGRAHWKMITYVFKDINCIQEGYVCLGVVPISEPWYAEEDEE